MNLCWICFVYGGQAMHKVLGPITGQFRHHPSASPAVKVRKMVGYHLFLNIIPSNFMARTERKVWCDRGINMWRFFQLLVTCRDHLPFFLC